MIDKICINLGSDHIYNCGCKIIGRTGENNIAQLEITLAEELNTCWVYIDFKKPDGTTFRTPKLDIIDNKVIYDIPNSLLDMYGYLCVQIVLQKESGEVWKSTIHQYAINKSLDAIDDIPYKEDFITNAQTLLNEIEAGLTPTIGENENWFVLDKDTGKPSRGPKGDAYIITKEDLEEVETNVKTDVQPIIEEIENVAKQAEIIAKGRATGYVFDTLEDLNLWLQDSENTSKLVLGDNLYIRALGVPDYWWDGVTKQVLETEKPDLTAYAKTEQFVTLTQEEYDKLETKSANTYYFIIEEE